MTRPLDPDTLIFGLYNASDPQVSPDGSRLVYTFSHTDRDLQKSSSHIWMCDIDGGNPRQLTNGGSGGNGGKDRSARWSPDGQRLAFLSSRAGGCRLFVLPVSGPGEAREITRHVPDIADITWSPDSSRLAYTAPVDPANPDERPFPAGNAPRVRVTRRIDYKQDGLGYLGDTRRQVFVLDVASGVRRQMTAGPQDHYSPQWSPDGGWLAMQVPNRNGMCSQLGLLEVETGEMKLVGPEAGVVGAWAWSPEGDRILFAGERDKTWQLDLFLYDVEGGQILQLTADLPCAPDDGFLPLAPPAHPVWLDGRYAAFHGFRAGASGLYLIDTQTGQLDMLHIWQAQNTGFSTDTARRYFAQAYSTMESTGALVIYDLQANTSRVIANQNAPLLQEQPPAQWERVEGQRGEYAIDSWLLKPPDFDPGRRYPVILDVHGGPHRWHGYGFTPLQQCLATHGFLVVAPNPRGSGSYGRTFARQVVGDWAGADYLDLLAVLDFALERPYADRDRTGIYGHSYGGYIVAWAIGQTQRFRAAVCGAPVFDLESHYGTSDISHTFGDKEWGGPPHQQRDWYAAHSPSTIIHHARTPTLIVHGEADERCPIGQGEQMFIALQKAGCEVEFVRYPGGSHLFNRAGPPEHRVDWLGRVLGWFQRYLGGPVGEIG
jgi:dipeptidyl aminopeptidase/acylaminoacyl peptidase